MNLIVNHVPISQKRRPGTKMTPISITIHSTGNPKSTSKNERAWLVNPSNDRTASWHYCVDENTIIEAIPPNEIAWHAGNEKGNYTSIGVEICESGNREKTLANAKEFVVYLMRKYKIEKIVRHFDWSGKICPSIMYDSGKWTTWSNFYWGVIEEYKAGSREVPTTVNGIATKAIVVGDNTHLIYSFLRDVGLREGIDFTYEFPTKDTVKFNVLGVDVPAVLYKGDSYLQWNKIPTMKEPKQRKDGGWDFTISKYTPPAPLKPEPKPEPKPDPKPDPKPEPPKDVVDRLVNLGVVNTPDYWKGLLEGKQTLNIDWLKILLTRAANKLEGK